MMSTPRSPRIVSSPEPPARWSPVCEPMIVSSPAPPYATMPTLHSTPAVMPASAEASIVSWPAYTYGLASGKTNFRAPLPISFGNGLSPKKPTDWRVGSPLYHWPSWLVSPNTTSDELGPPPPVITIVSPPIRVAPVFGSRTATTAPAGTAGAVADSVSVAPLSAVIVPASAPLTVTCWPMAKPALPHGTPSLRVIVLAD